MPSTTHHFDGNHWGYLLNQDKSAAPLLRQLCEALAKIVVGGASGTDER
jgi:hypothetical protein